MLVYTTQNWIVRLSFRFQMKQIGKIIIYSLMQTNHYHIAALYKTVRHWGNAISKHENIYETCHKLLKV